MAKLVVSYKIHISPNIKIILKVVSIQIKYTVDLFGKNSFQYSPKTGCFRETKDDKTWLHSSLFESNEETARAHLVVY